MSTENTFDNIDEVLSNIPDNYSIMEESIDLEVQKEFFESIKNLKKEPNSESTEALIEALSQNIEDKSKLKTILQKLSTIDAVNAYRAIEEFNKNAQGELKEWSLLAFQQSRMVIQSSLMGEQQVFITTGLGGKNNMLRYYLIFPYNNRKELTKIENQTLKSELEFHFSAYNGIIEEIEYQSKYSTALVLIPLKTNITDLVNIVLNECNQFGNYLSENVLITNMKKFTTEEILQILENNEEE